MVIDIVRVIIPPTPIDNMSTNDLYSVVNWMAGHDRHWMYYTNRMGMLVSMCRDLDDRSPHTLQYIGGQYVITGAVQAERAKICLRDSNLHRLFAKWFIASRIAVPEISIAVTRDEITGGYRVAAIYEGRHVIPTQSMTSISLLETSGKEELQTFNIPNWYHTSRKL